MIRPFTILVNGPATEPVTADEAKLFCGVPGSDTAENALFMSLIQVARETVENFTGRSLATQSWGYTAHRWPREQRGYFANWRHADDWRIIELSPSPLIAVQSVKYYPEDGGAQATLSSALYSVVTGAMPGSVVLGFNQSWPDLADLPNAVEIAFTAGHSPANPLPATLVNCVKLMVKHLYDRRDSWVMGQSVNEVPGTVNDLMMPYRIRGMIF